MATLGEYEELAKKAIEVAEKIPEKYREKCFEVIFKTLLMQKTQPQVLPVPPPDKQEKVKQEGKFIIPIDVRAFLQQYDVSEDKLSKIFLTQEDNIRPIYKIETTKKSKAQIQISLLSALENALHGGKFEFNVTTIRQYCKDYKAYDGKNFTANFKNNSKLFKDLSDEEHVELSPDGKAELAETIMEITK